KKRRMQVSSSASTRSLAGYLRTLTDPQLAELLAARTVRGSSIRDFFDLADALLEPESIQLALGRIDRSALVALTVLAEHGPLQRADAAAHLERIAGDSRSLDPALERLEALALVSDDAGVLGT